MIRFPEYYLSKPVLSLQTMLRQISASDSRILPIIPDGYYGKSTYAAVRSFQQAYNLPDTGDADLETWAAIAKVFDQTVVIQTPPTTRPIWPTDRVLRPGSSNYHLYLVQAMLIVLSDVFPDLQSPNVTGALDKETQAGLKWVQHAADLPETGTLDTATWHALNGLYRIMAGDGTLKQKE